MGGKALRARLLGRRGLHFPVVGHAELRRDVRAPVGRRGRWIVRRRLFGVGVDKAGIDGAASGVDHLGIGGDGDIRPDCGDDPIAHDNMGLLDRFAGRGDDASAHDGEHSRVVFAEAFEWPGSRRLRSGRLRG